MADYERLLATAEQCGLKIISDEWCAKLLAWLYLFGGGQEMTVFNTKLRSDIFEAQRRANLFGGERPDAEMCDAINGYINACGGWDAIGDAEKGGWLDREMQERYGG